MIKKIILILIAFLSSLVSMAQSKEILAKKYITQYSELAILEMDRYKIPASITMAQGILESGYGKGRLSVQANNHFGIKCKSTWKGDKIYHDDDALQECFRVYDSAKDSYEDHSRFLIDNPRYAMLFEFDATDYESWAHGLKKCGYATNPKYAYLLIGIIERYNLHMLDMGNSKELLAELNSGTDVTTPTPIQQNDIIQEMKKINPQIKVIHVYGGLKVYKHNKSEFVVTSKGDTYENIAQRLDKKAKRLASYNNVSGSNLPVGDIVYITKKSCRTPKGVRSHIVQDGETLYTISQKYAIHFGWLCNRNDVTRGERVSVGERIRLR